MKAHSRKNAAPFLSPVTPVRISSGKDSNETFFSDNSNEEVRKVNLSS
jgi:hypothetical protein